VPPAAADRRQSAEVGVPELPPENAILFKQIGERLPLPAIQPTDDAEEQHVEDR
jgi:hypothetical protein